MASQYDIPHRLDISKNILGFVSLWGCSSYLCPTNISVVICSDTADVFAKTLSITYRDMENN